MKNFDKLRKKLGKRSKMRNIKKFLARSGHFDLLQLAMIIGLLRFDPNNSSLNPFYNSQGGISNITGFGLNADEEVWTDVLRPSDTFGFVNGGGDLSPSVHPKSIDSIEDILHDLGNLGRFDRLRNRQDQEISAYILDATVTPTASSSRRQRPGSSAHSESDSGISDTENAAGSVAGNDLFDDLEEDEDKENKITDDDLNLDLDDIKLEECNDENLLESDIKVEIHDELPEIKIEAENLSSTDNLMPDVKIEDGSADNNLPELDIELSIPDDSEFPLHLPVDEEDVVNQLIHIDDRLSANQHDLEEISEGFLTLDQVLAEQIQEDEQEQQLEKIKVEADSEQKLDDEDLMVANWTSDLRNLDLDLGDDDDILGDGGGLSMADLLLAEDQEEIDLVSQPVIKEEENANVKAEGEETEGETEKPKKDDAFQKSSSSTSVNGESGNSNESSAEGEASSNGSTSAGITPNVRSSFSSPKNAAEKSSCQKQKSSDQNSNKNGDKSQQSDEQNRPTEWGGEVRKFEESNLEDLFPSTEAVLRNVSLGTVQQQQNTQQNTDGSVASTNNLASSSSLFGASALAGFSMDLFGSSDSLDQTNNQNSQQNFNGDLSSAEQEMMKEIANVFGGHNAESMQQQQQQHQQQHQSTEDLWNRGGSGGVANNGNNGGRNNTDALSSASTFSSFLNGGDDTNNSTSYAGSYHGGQAIPHGSNSSASSYIAAMAAAAGVRYPTASVGGPVAVNSYTPLLNHSYAAPPGAAAANLPGPSSLLNLGNGGPGSAALSDTDMETASQISSQSKEFNFDPTTIKADPDSEYAHQQQAMAAAQYKARQSRDERKAREIGVPFSIHDIINLPMDEFNDLLSRHELTEEQLNLCRDIRRRGKNKVAAQNCRKRKIDQISHLEIQVREMRVRKARLLSEREELRRAQSEWFGKLASLEEDILTSMNKNPKEWALGPGAQGDGGLAVVSRMEMVGYSDASSSSGTRSRMIHTGGMDNLMHLRGHQPTNRAGTSGASGSSANGSNAGRFQIWKGNSSHQRGVH